jgi:hypothetical protein
MLHNGREPLSYARARVVSAQSGGLLISLRTLIAARRAAFCAPRLARHGFLVESFRQLVIGDTFFGHAKL